MKPDKCVTQRSNKEEKYFFLGSSMGNRKIAKKDYREQKPIEPRIFVSCWLDAYAAGQNPAFVGLKLGIGRSVYVLAQAARAKGIRLPFLWGERSILGDQVDKLNQYIDSRLEKIPVTTFRPKNKIGEPLAASGEPS